MTHMLARCFIYGNCSAMIRSLLSAACPRNPEISRGNKIPGFRGQAAESRLRGAVRAVTIYIVLCFNLALSHAAADPSNDWFSKSNTAGVVLNVDLFVSSTCPHCHQAEAFFRELIKTTPWINVKRHVINESKTQLDLFYQKLQIFHANDFSVPTIMFCDSRWVGFADANTTGKGLLRALMDCRHQIQKEGRLTDATRQTLRQWSATSQSNVKVVEKQPASLLERIVVSALMEALTPCALFCLLIWLSMLWLYPDRRDIRFYLGLLFIVTLGMLHTAQFVFTGLYQAWILNHLRGVSLMAGVALLVYAMQYYRARWRSGPQYAMVWMVPVMLLGVASVYSYQQTCDFSVGAMFQQWLQTQTMTSAAFYFCQLTYLGFYLLPVMGVLVFYAIFNVHPRQILPAAGCLILAIIGVLLLTYPSGLSNMTTSSMVLMASILMGWRYTRQISDD